MGRSELSALISLLASPLGLCLFLFAVAIVLFKARPRVSFRALLLSAGLLWFVATPKLANTLAHRIELGYPSYVNTQGNAVDAIVLLGGGVRNVRNSEDLAEFNEAGDRVIHAYRLFNEYEGAMIICVGGQVFGDQFLSEAEYMRDILVQFGVPPENILIEPTSLNTRENAIATARLLRQPDVFESRGFSHDSIYLLVTSVGHMRRAMYSFSQAGLTVLPAPTDYRATVSGHKLTDYLPSAGALAWTSSIIREWLAMLAYRRYATDSFRTLGEVSLRDLTQSSCLSVGNFECPV